MSWRRYIYSQLASELATIARYFTTVREWSGDAPGNPLLFELLRAHQVRDTNGALPDDRVVFILNGALNHSLDIQSLLLRLRRELRREDRAVVVAYNPYLAWIYSAANAVGLRKGPRPATFVTRADLANLARLCDLEIVRYRPSVYAPWRLLGIGSLINFMMPMIPLFRHLALTAVITLRPRARSETLPTLSVIIPARNERGNIANALDRMPAFKAGLEVLFVEGGSTDGTWEEIQRLTGENTRAYEIRSFRQAGRGKNDAVRLGVREAKHDLVVILDADLTVPPELLPRFYDAYVAGHADFVNGSRLVYPMEGEAMRPLNRLGNIFFAKALSFVLDTRLTDSLCGTKLLSRADWLRVQAWREDFGDFDPFGDFELLFPAAILGLGVIDVPIRYRDRVYGTTNISRFRHGAQLLRMTIIGLFKVKAGR